MIPQRAALCGQVGQEERIVLPRRHGGSVQIGQVLVQHGQIAGHRHVIRHRMRQPDAIVRNAGPHPLTRMGQPPVLHIALRKLPGCRMQQMRTHPCGLGQRHRHPVLQLIAKAVCAAGLIECRAGLNAAGQRLIGQPAVHHDVHGPVRGRHLDGADDRLPMRLDLCQQVCGVRIAHAGDHRLCFGGRGRLSQQMPDLHRGARRQQHRRFQRQAGVKARACAPRQAGGRGGQRTVRSQNLGPVAADGGLRAHQVGEHHPVGKGHVPRVADQKGPGVRIAFADQMLRRPGAGDTHHRLRAGDHGQALRLRAQVADPQGRDPYGTLQRHELQQLQRQTACVMVEPAIAHAVAGHVPSGPRQRAGCGRKDRARVVVADQEGLGCAVRDRVVGPGGQAVFAAVFGPGAARAGGRDVKAEAVIGDHVDPGRGGGPALVQDHHVFAPVAGKAAGAVEELQRLGQAGRGVGPGWRAVRHAGHAGGLGGRCSHRGHLIGQWPVARDQHNACGGEQQRGDLGRQQVAAKGMDLTARRIGLCPRTGTAQRGLDGRLQALDIGRRVFVQDHHVHGQALHAPVFLRQQDLFDLRHVGLIRDAHQHDGQIAGDALRPQHGLLAGCPGGDRGAEPRVGPQDWGGHRLERRGLGRGDPQMAQLHLGLGPGQGPRAVDRVAVMMSVDQVDQARPRVGHHRPEGQSRRPPRRDGDAMAQREGRVQHGADPALQRGPRCQGRRVAQIVVAAQKGGAVGLELHGRGLGGLDHREMGGPDAWLVRAARAAGGDQRAVFGQVFGLHEHLGKGGMRGLGLRRGQDQLGIGGQLQRHRHAGGRGQRQHPHLCVVLARHQHLQRGGQGAVPALEQHAILEQLDAGVIGGVRAADPGQGLRAQIAHPETAPALVAGGIGPGPRDRQRPPPAGAATRGGQGHAIAAIGQDMRDRRPVGRPLDHGHALHVLGRGRAGGAGVRAGDRGGNVARDAFLEQQFGRADRGFGVEPRAHAPVLQHVGDGDDGHALVMRHVAAHQRHSLPGGAAQGREIQRLVKAEGPHRAQIGQLRQVVCRRLRIDHRGQRAGIGRHDQICLQPPLEAKIGHAKAGILVIHLQVARVETGFRQSPRHPAAAAIALLGHDRLAVRLIQQAARRFVHDQDRHQVFEHRPRPRPQSRTARHRDGRAAKPEPVGCGNVALGDGEQAGQPRLGRQQVIAAAVAGVLGLGKADRQQLAVGVQQKAELHGPGHVMRLNGQCAQGVRQVEVGIGQMRRRLMVQRCQPRAIRARPTGQPRDGGPFGLRRGDGGRDPVHQLGVAIRAGKVQRVQQAGADVLVRRVGPVLAGLRQRDQVPGQIAAVHGRDIARGQHRAIGRIVPVEQVAIQFFQRCDRFQRLLQAGHRLGQADPAEIPRGDAGQQIEADIRGRGAGRRQRHRRFLMVVGRQVTVFGRHEGLKEMPGPTRGQAQGPRGFGRQGPRIGGLHPPAALRDQGCGQPQQGKGQDQRHPGRGNRRDNRHDDHGQRQTARHAARQRGKVRARPDLILRGGGPFQQVAARHPHAPGGAQDRVAHAPRGVGQHGQCQRQLRQRRARIARRLAQVAAHIGRRAARHHAQQHGQDRGQGQRDQQQRRRRDRLRRQPACQQRGQRERRQQRPAQGIGDLDASQHGRGRVGHAPRQLPVAAGPAVLAGGGQVVAGGERLDHLDVRGQARAGEHPLQQVVA